MVKHPQIMDRGPSSWALKGAAFTLLRRQQHGSECTRSGGPQDGGAGGFQGRCDGAISQQMSGKQEMGSPWSLWQAQRYQHPDLSPRC